MTRSAKPSTPRSGTKAPIIKRADVEAMLLSTQKKLFDAEIALTAQTTELEALRAQAEQQQTEFGDLRSAYYDAQVEVSLAQHDCQSAKADKETAVAEVRHLTQILVEQTNAAQSTTEMEINDLRAELSTAQTAAKDVDFLRLRVEEQDQKLADNTREMADMTILLSQSEKRLEENTDQKLEPNSHELADMAELLDTSERHWQENNGTLQVALKAGQTAVTALIEPPDTLRLDQERLNRAAAALVESGAFDAEWYLAMNGDVAESGADPALHFLEFGFAEGRAPRAIQ